ncbi:nucleotidyltransferase family protein [Kordiimonas aquimaris]|uniref:nucleotidyltransferase family protein n=1 Tax=Kordiimonas aquimaris TaxID=707591 RepID=UPI0021CDF5AB|nr:NTP transferase domain-containing protein [Kordiimonas aquimaris]
MCWDSTRQHPPRDFTMGSNTVNTIVTDNMKTNNDANQLEKSHKNVRFTAILLAGSRSTNDSVASIFGKTYKALVPLVGRPMIAYALDALKRSSFINDIIIVFDGKDELLNENNDLKAALSDDRISIIGPASSICASVKKAIDQPTSKWPFLVTTADHALLKPEIVDKFCDQVSKIDGLSVGFVEKQSIVAMHPSSKRTYLPFKNASLSGANLFGFTDKEAVNVLDFWVAFESKRKTPWRLFQAFGFINLIGLMLRRFDVKSAFRRASMVLNVNAHAVILEDAEAAIDVDTPKDYMQVTSILEMRQQESQTS